MLGTQFRAIRTKKQLTQEQVASGIASRSYVSDIERGKSVPSAGMLAQLAKRLDVPLSCFSKSFSVAPASPVQKLEFAALLAKQCDVSTAQEFYSLIEPVLLAESQSYAAEVYETKGLIAYENNALEAARKYFEKAVEVRDKTPSHSFELAQALFRLGTIEMRSGSLASATGSLYRGFVTFQWHEQSQRHIGVSKERKLRTSLVNALTLVLLQRRHTQAAVAVLNYVEQTWEKRGIALPTQLKLLHAISLVGIRQLDKAKRILRHVLLEADLTPLNALLAHNYLAIIYRLNDQYTDSEAEQLIAWRIDREHSLGKGRGICNELAKCALNQEAPEKAKLWLERAESFSSRFETELQAETALIQARVDATMNRIDLARKSLRKAEQLDIATGIYQKQITLERARLAALEKNDELLLRHLDELRQQLALDSL